MRLTLTLSPLSTIDLLRGPQTTRFRLIPDLETTVIVLPDERRGCVYIFAQAGGTSTDRQGVFENFVGARLFFRAGVRKHLSGWRALRRLLVPRSVEAIGWWSK